MTLKKWFPIHLDLKRIRICTILLFILVCAPQALPCLAATFLFRGQVTAVYPQSIGFPEEYLSVSVGDKISGRIRFTGSGEVNPFGVWEQSTQYAFMPTDSIVAGTMGDVPFDFNNKNLLISVWNNDNLDYRVDCNPIGEYDGILIGTTGPSLDVPSVTIGNYCLPVTTFQDESLPNSTINETFFFQIGPRDFSSAWIIGTIDLLTYRSFSQELPSIMLLLGPDHF